MKFFDEGDTVSLNEIDAFAQAIGKRLPGPYRDFLLAHNGGRPEPAVIDIDDCPSGASVVQMFLGLTGPVESETLLWSWNVFSGRIPERLLPIADDPFGNLFCLSVDGDDLGQVFFLDRYEESESRPYFVAKDFDEFLSRLREPRAEELAGE